LCRQGNRASIATVTGRSDQLPPGAWGAIAARECLDENQALAYAFRPGSATLPDPQARHLDGCARCQALVAEATRVRLATGADNRAAQPRTLRDGELCLGRYEIVGFIGAGGMGEVYQALDRELGGTIALKTVALTTLDDQRAVERLRAEVQLARRITHPNVCRIFDFGVHLRARPGLVAEPVPLLTMELLAGETLATCLRRSGRLSVDATRPILRQMLAGLGAVHRAGIVHRDLKAENVFLVAGADGEGRRAVLMDFGLARLAFPDGGAQVSFQHTLAGTASYMAPEQVEGRPVSFASDIYAVGVVAFEMTTGRLPFVGATAMEVALQRLTVPPPRPSALVADLDPGWEALILKCLQRDPRDRYGSVEELTDALEARGRAGRAPRRLRTLAGLAVGLAITLGAGVWIVHRAGKESPAEASSAFEARMAAWRAAEAVHTRAIEKDPAHAAGHFVDRSIVREERAALGGRDALADFAAAEDDLDRAMAIDPTLSHPYYRRGRLRVMRAELKLKYGLDPRDDLTAAEPDLARLLRIEQARSWMGQLHYVRGLWQEQTGGDGRAEFATAEAILTPANDSPTLMRRGLARAHLGRFAEAERDFAESVRTAPENPWPWTWWGLARALAGDLTGAEAQLSRAAAIDPDDLSGAWEQRARVRFARHAYAEAVADYQQAIAINPALEPLLAPRLREAQALAGR
jgi:tetratricopeptide (TPR) repeat protein